MIPSPPLLLFLTGYIDTTVRRSSGGQRVKGVWQEGVRQEITIKANCQPVLKTSETQVLPEGDRYKDSIRIFTAEPLIRTVEGDNPVDGDLIFYEGYWYEVKKVGPWKMGVLDHFESMAVRKEIT